MLRSPLSILVAIVLITYSAADKVQRVFTDFDATGEPTDSAGSHMPCPMCSTDSPRGYLHTYECERCGMRFSVKYQAGVMPLTYGPAE